MNNLEIPPLYGDTTKVLDETGNEVGKSLENPIEATINLCKHNIDTIEGLSKLANSDIGLALKYSDPDKRPKDFEKLMVPQIDELDKLIIRLGTEYFNLSAKNRNNQEEIYLEEIKAVFENMIEAVINLTKIILEKGSGQELGSESVEVIKNFLSTAAKQINDLESITELPLSLINIRDNINKNIITKVESAKKNAA